jgi:hypothetical protein
MKTSNTEEQAAHYNEEKGYSKMSNKETIQKKVTIQY